ncbi:hypothetical protein Tco_0216907 [Tanacetum coccineum]
MILAMKRCEQEYRRVLQDSGDCSGDNGTGGYFPIASKRKEEKDNYDLSRENQNWAFGILECPHLTWKPTQIMIMLEQILTGNPQQEVVNFLAGDLFLGNAKSRPLWLLLLQRQNMLLLQIAVGNISLQNNYEKKLIQVLKIHTDDNVADLLTKEFDVRRFQFLVVIIGMINP